MRFVFLFFFILCSTYLFIFISCKYHYKFLIKRNYTIITFIKKRVLCKNDKTDQFQINHDMWQMKICSTKINYFQLLNQRVLVLFVLLILVPLDFLYLDKLWRICCSVLKLNVLKFQSTKIQVKKFLHAFDSFFLFPRSL